MSQAPRIRRRVVAAALLLVAAALVLSLGEREPAPTERARVAFPNHMRHPEVERSERRATLTLPAPPPEPGEPPPAPPPQPRDPFVVGMPVEPGDAVVVFEANALRHSRLGELFVGCILARDPDAFSGIQQELGVDPLKDVDRVAFVGDTVVVSGFFGRLETEQLEADARPERHGQAGRLWIPARAQGGDAGPAVALWQDQLLLFSDDPEDLRRAIDQLEGRLPVPDAGIPEEMAYGEVYGVIPGAAARRFFGRDERGLGERIATLATRVELHADARSDLAAVVRVRGDDAAGLSDLARSLGAALSVARVQAHATDDRRFAELLESARVVDHEGGLSLELAVPAERLEAWFEGCGGPPPQLH